MLIALAQLVERRPFSESSKPAVAGSIPACGNLQKSNQTNFLYELVRVVKEAGLRSAGASRMGSNPIARNFALIV